MLVTGMRKFPFIKIINKNKINPPIAYLEKTKKKRDEPSSRAIFAEWLGSEPNISGLLEKLLSQC